MYHTLSETDISQSGHQEDCTQFYFHKVDKIAAGSSYKTLKLWEIHNFIFTNVSLNKNFVP